MRIRVLAAGLAAAGIAVAVVLGSQALLRRDQTLQDRAETGRTLWEQHCAVCHGHEGRGDGPGAKVTGQRIPDFTNADAMRGASDQFLFDIIQKGGSQFGRSNAMPAWGMQLRNEQIWSLVGFIRSLAARPSLPPTRRETP